MHYVHAYSIVLMFVVQWSTSCGAFHDAPREERRNEERNNLHPGRVILYRPVTTNTIPDFNQNYESAKHHTALPTHAPTQQTLRTKSYDYNEYKLPASKYTNDYFQPPRPRPTPNQMQKRVSFAFPDSHRQDNFFWAQRGAIQQQNLVEYNQNQEVQHNFHHRHPGVITYENGDLHKHRPALFQRTVTPGLQADGSNVIVASGPGGIKHIIHDLRVQQQPQVNQQKILPLVYQQREPKPDFVQHRFASGFNQPEPQVYKGIPVFVQGGTFGGKDYDPRFVTLYRQVLEENQKRVVPKYRFKTQPFNPSPVFGWYSEPDPLYHSQNPQFITSPPVDSTIPSTLEPIRNVESVESFPDSINSQLPPPTANDNHFQYQASTDQTQQSPTPTAGTETTESAQEKIPEQEFTTKGELAAEISILQELKASVTTVTEDLIEPASTTPTSGVNEESTQQSPSLPEDSTSTTSTDTVLTTISKSDTSARDPKTSEDFQNLNITQRLSEEIQTITTIAEEKETPTTEAPIETTTDAMDETTTAERSTMGDREETMATTNQAQTEAVVSERSSSVAESGTQQTTTAADMALTTMNFLVMSLMNQARVIASENATTVTTMVEDVTAQSSSVS